jgi:CheY-like chemotaxis protein
MTFSLIHRPGTVVILDDDPNYLELLAMVLPNHWHIRLFVRPVQCVYDLHREPRLWEQDRWTHQAMVDLWRQGKPLIPQILQYWATTPERYGLAHVCVVDFSMPGMDGLQVLSEFVGWPGARILLTGQADERVAVGAFNRGLIDQYIPKQASNVTARLTEVIEILSHHAYERHDPIWRSTLRPDQQELLAERPIQDALRTLAKRQWVEYMLIGQPFGILGLEASGQVSWLQLETREGLATMVELAKLQGADSHSLQTVQEGRCLLALELRQALGLQGPGTPLTAFALTDDDRLLAALYALPSSALPAQVMGHEEWLSRQAPRRLRE